MVIITKILLEGGNLVLKDASDNVLHVIPSVGTYANADSCLDNIIHLSNKPADKEPTDWNATIDYTKITDPKVFVSRNELMQELSDNYLNNPLNVVVDNQIDLSTIESLLTQIRDSAQAIDENTDEVEIKLDSIILEIQNSSNLNHSDLLQVISLLQSLDSNTDGLEAQLSQIITNTSNNATEITLQAIKSQTDKLTFVSNKLRTTGEDGGSSIDLNLDAGGRLRVSELTTLIDIKQIFDDAPLFIDTETGGTGSITYDQANARSVLSVSADRDYVIRQTKMRFNYQSGKSHYILNTFYDFAPQTNVVKRVGYFNSDVVAPYDSSYDGIFLESINGTVRAVVVRNGLRTFDIPQSAWDDPLDGTGSSGVTIDWNNSNVLIIDFLWLGVDKIRFSFDIDDKLITFYTAKYANNQQSVYMQSPNHSIRYEIRSTGGAGDFSQVCSSVNVEGSRNNLGKILGYNIGGGTGLNFNTSGNPYMALAFRLKTNNYGAEIDVLVFSLLGATADSFLWELLLNPTVTGLNDVDFIDQNGSALQIAIGGNNRPIVDKGLIIDNGYVSQKAESRNTIENSLRLGVGISGERDLFVLAITPLTNNLTAYPSFTRREVI